MRILSTLALTLATLAAAPLPAQTDSLPEILAATALNHRGFMRGGGDAWHLEGTGMGGTFLLEARRNEVAWELSMGGPGDPEDDNPAAVAAGVLQGALQVLLAGHVLFVADDAFRLTGVDTADGRPAYRVELDPESSMGRQFIEGTRARGQTVERMTFLIDRERRVITGLRMLGQITADDGSKRPLEMVVEFGGYQPMGPVTLPARYRVVMHGVAPVMSPEERKQAETTLAEGTKAMALMSGEEQERMETYLHMMEEMLVHNRMVVEGRIVSASPGLAN